MRVLSLIRTIATGLVLLAIAACGFFGESRSWVESVQLDDGSSITIKRYVRFETSNSFAGDVPRAEDRRSTLSFLGALSDLPGWEAPLTPMVLYQDASTKQWVIVALTDRCEAWEVWGAPFPPYWEYRLSAGKWRLTPLSESSRNRQTNLLIDYRRKGLPRHITLEHKRTSYSTAPYSEIYRRVVPDIRRHCMVDAK